MVARHTLPKPPRMEIDEGARRWMIKYAHREAWRVAAWIDIDDLIQDGYLTWYRIVEGQQVQSERRKRTSVMVTYPWITSRKIIMSLFQRLYMNHITNLANSRTYMSPLEYPMEDYMDAPSDEQTPILLENAPPEVKAVLELISTDKGRDKLSQPMWQYLDGTRETTDEYYSRLTGIRGNVATKVKEYFAT